MSGKPGPVDPVVAALRKRRREVGLSGHAVAVRAGLNTTTIRHLEQGRLSSTLHTIRALAEALDCDLYVVPRTLGGREGTP